MSPDAQRIAIAEACGWTKCETAENRVGKKTTGGQPPNDPDVYRWMALPDYLTDLNACHEAEKALTEEQLYLFYNKLNAVMDKAPRRFGNAMAWESHRMTATAAQRAEAFLRATNLWTT